MITPELHARLLAAFVAAAGTDQGGVGALAARYRLLPLYQSWTDFIGLAADGELHSVDWDPPHEVAVVQEASWRRVAFVVGARDFPELASLRPSPPADAVTCPTCRGTRRATVDGRAVPDNILCQCAGLGWIPADEARGPGAPDT